MSKYKYIKSREEMVYELHKLWDNEELLTFMKGPEYIERREIEITECLTNMQREMLLILAKFDYLLK